VGDELQFRIEASHFLWRMVRRIVGALVRVGTGELPLADFAAALDGDVRYQDALSRWTAPAAGLYLEAVRYPADLRGVIKPPRHATPLRRNTPSRPAKAPKRNGRGFPRP
jgi:tRNA U38,U39,U40 pseudouridine synthase TruA